MDVYLNSVEDDNIVDIEFILRIRISVSCNKIVSFTTVYQTFTCLTAQLRKAFENPFLPFPKQALVFTCPQYKSFENTVGKGEIAHNEQFFFPFLTVFSFRLENFLAIFIKF